MVTSPNSRSQHEFFILSTQYFVCISELTVTLALYSINLSVL